MTRPLLEIADLIRTAGATFIERNHQWICWRHVSQSAAGHGALPHRGVNVYSSHIVVSTEGRSAKFGEEAFANLALALIGKFVREVRVDEQRFHIVFADKSEMNELPLLMFTRL